MAANKNRKIYNSGELDRTRQNLGIIIPEEAKGWQPCWAEK